MLINHDLNAAHQVRLVIEGANDTRHSLAAPLALVQFANNPSDNKNATINPSRDAVYSLPAGSITVLRGELR